MAGNRWLFEQLTAAGRNVEPGYDPVMTVTYRNKVYRVYSPGNGAYVLGVDVVQTALDLGATHLAYAKYCEPSEEALAYARHHGLEVVKYGALLGMLHAHPQRK
jgi:hypothetical protein